MQIPKLIFNARAYFEAAEKYPGGIANEVAKDDKAGFDALCWALSELSTQAELIRRDLGYDKAPILPPEYFALALTPKDLLSAKNAVLQAIIKGLNAGDNEDEEVDEVLAELQKKTAARG